MTDVVKYVSNKLIESEANADIRPGSALHDLMISPLSAILSPYSKEHTKLINFLSLKDPESMSEDELDYIASNFFLERHTGNTVTGAVRLYYNAATDVEIPKGTKFSTASGKNFYTTYTYSISRTDMLSNVEGSLYYAGDVTVSSETGGSEYNVLANEISEVSTITKMPVRVRNPKTFTGGGTRESNTDFAERILYTFVNSNLLTEAGIEKTIVNNVSNIKDVQVVGAGSSYMLRDIVAADTDDTVSFLGKVAGHTVYPNNACRAYKKVYAAYDPAIPSGVELPDVDQFTKEFIQSEYYSLYYNGDGLQVTTIDEREFEPENINGGELLFSGLGTGSYVNDGWCHSDGILGPYKYDIFEFALRPQHKSIALGAQQAEWPDRTNIDLHLIAELSVLLARSRDGYLDDGDRSRLLHLISEISVNLEDPDGLSKIFDFSPIFHREVAINNGVEVAGKFHTTDDTTDGRLSYITVGRNVSSVTAPHDGYGIAWRKGDGNTYNIYAVDNNVLEDDIWIGKNMLVQDYGINNFLYTVAEEILADTWYWFKMQISENYGIKFWLSSPDVDDIDVLNDTPTLEYGGQFGSVRPAANGNHFGVSVAGTKNNEWMYGELSMRVIGDNYPLHMFEFVLPSDTFKSSDICTLNYYGYGMGDNSTDTSMKLYLYDPTDEEWDEVAGHDNYSGEDIQAYMVAISGVAPTFALSDYGSLSGDNWLVYALAASDTHTAGSVDHTLVTDYIEVVREEGVHVGNHSDIYIEAPEHISTGTVTANVTNGKITLNNGVTDLLGPVQEVVLVSRNGVALDSDEWRATYARNGEAFMNSATIYIIARDVADGETLTITYRYLNCGPSVQRIVDSPDFRSPSCNNAVKVMPPYTVVVNNFPYKGNITAADLKVKLKSYINGLTSKTISKTDLISVALNAGCTNIEFNSLDIDIRYQAVNGSYFTTELVNQYTINTIGSFYTELSDLAGVAQV